MKPFLSLLLILSFTFGIVSAQKKQAIIYKSLEVPIIDGIEDDIWQFVQPNYIEKNYKFEFPTVNGLWKMLWDEENIYVIVIVDDDNHWPGWEAHGDSWLYDNVELYFDLNSPLEDGLGSSRGDGHYQIASGFNEYGYGKLNQLQNGYTSTDMKGYFGYQLYDEGYVYEYEISMANLIDNKGSLLSPLTIQNRDIGFDVVVVDQDEGITTGRQRKVWQNDGATDECWATMDDAGIIRFENIKSDNDSVVCGTNTPFIIEIDIPIGNITQYTWNLDGGVLVDQDKNKCRAKWSEPGIKNIVLTVLDGNQQQTQLSKQLVVYPTFSVSTGERFSTCKNTAIEIIPEIENGVQPFSYYWNTKIGNSSYAETLTKSKSLFLSIQDDVGCVAASSVFITVLDQIAPDEISRVSVDDANNKNKIEWTKSDNKDIAEYQVLKESNVANKYQLVGTVAYGGDNFLIDEYSNPSKYADRYILKTVDKCDNVSIPSQIHKNIHLQVNAGLPGYFNLSWTPYIGFEYGSYYIYKGRTPEEMMLIDQISSSITQYTDTSATSVYYQVAVKPNTMDSYTTKSLATIPEARSNIEYIKRSSSKQFEIKQLTMFPNPTTGIVNFSVDVTRNMTYKVTELSGKLLMSGKLVKPTVDLNGLRPGQYIISISDEEEKIFSSPVQKE